MLPCCCLYIKTGCHWDTDSLSFTSENFFHFSESFNNDYWQEKVLNLLDRKLHSQIMWSIFLVCTVKYKNSYSSNITLLLKRNLQLNSLHKTSQKCRVMVYKLTNIFIYHSPKSSSTDMNHFCVDFVHFNQVRKQWLPVCEVYGAHSNVAEDSSHMGCNTV